MIGKELINIQTTDVRHGIPKICSAAHTTMAPKYGDNRSWNHPFKVILQQRSQKAESCQHDFKAAKRLYILRILRCSNVSTTDLVTD